MSKYFPNMFLTLLIFGAGQNVIMFDPFLFGQSFKISLSFRLFLTAFWGIFCQVFFLSKFVSNFFCFFLSLNFIIFFLSLKYFKLFFLKVRSFFKGPLNGLQQWP